MWLDAFFLGPTRPAVSVKTVLADSVTVMMRKRKRAGYLERDGDDCDDDGGGGGGDGDGTLRSDVWRLITW